MPVAITHLYRSHRTLISFTSPQTDEKTALVMNIVIPPKPAKDRKEYYLVLLWIHGGSLLHGSANYGIYDAVNLVSHSVDIGWPVVVVTFNYRLGLGGFLESSQISSELQRDGFSGNGNFGFTDQRLASEWVQKYIGQFGGDSGNLCAIGQSAGAISIGHHMAAEYLMVFHRAICMSGLGSTLLCLSPEEHQEIFNATCRYFSIDSKSTDTMNQLREIPEQALADADPIIQGVPSGSGNPCFDGWFYDYNPQNVTQAPPWLKAFLLGDVKDEGLIFEVNLEEDTFQKVRETLLGQVQDTTFVDTLLGEYGITSDRSFEELIDRTCQVGAEAVFKIQNYQTALINIQLQDRLFKYHFDQRSELLNIQGKAYHGLDVLYLFMNLNNKLTEAERNMSRDLTSAWILFASGQAPWPSGTGHGPWKIWDPASEERMETEEEGEKIRSYSRFDRMIRLGSGGK